MGELIIKIDNIYKQYRLGTISGGTLQADLQSWWAKVRKKEDPNQRIGVKSYNKNEKFVALDGINLEVCKGDTLGIIGANGAGKSTLLKILSRVTSPTKGCVYINGRISSMLEVGTGFNGELTGRENIYLNGAILGMSKAEVDSKIEQIIDFSEVKEFIDTPVKRYSSGMYVKLAFAVAAHLDSEILVMDEVLAVGDMKFQEKCLGKMGDVASKEGRTVIYVSHNMHTIRQLCNRCVVLDKGKIIYDGNVEEAIQIYSNGFMKKISSYWDHEKELRPDYVNQNVLIKTIEIIMNDNSELSLKFVITSRRDIFNLYIRLIVKTNEGSAIGMCTTEEPFNIRENETKVINLVMNISNLANNNYFSVATLYQINEFGTDTLCDVVQYAFNFLVERKNKNNLQWKKNIWGSICMDSLRIGGYKSDT